MGDLVCINILGISEKNVCSCVQCSRSFPFCARINLRANRSVFKYEMKLSSQVDMRILFELPGRIARYDFHKNNSSECGQIWIILSALSRVIFIFTNRFENTYYPPVDASAIKVEIFWIPLCNFIGDHPLISAALLVLLRFLVFEFLLDGVSPQFWELQSLICRISQQTSLQKWLCILSLRFHPWFLLGCLATWIVWWTGMWIKCNEEKSWISSEDRHKSNRYNFSPLPGKRIKFWINFSLRPLSFAPISFLSRTVRKYWRYWYRTIFVYVRIQLDWDIN